MLDSLPEQLRNKYKYHKEAEAMFFKTIHGGPAFRFEIPSLGWEFSDNFWIGPDPMGTFYYGDEFLHLDKNRSTPGDYFVDQWTDPVSHERYVYIQFFAEGTRQKLVGEFLGKDTYDVSGRSGLLHEYRSAKWKKTNFAFGTALASKAKGQTEITVSCPSLGETAKFHCSTSDKLYNDTVNDVEGQLTIKSLKDLHKATWVRWYKSYVVFHEGRDATDWAAFFYPSEGVTDPLGSQDEMRAQDVQWARALRLEANNVATEH